MMLFFLSILQWTLICLFTVYLVSKYAHAKATLLVKAVTFTGWYLGFSIIAILPLDILTKSQMYKLSEEEQLATTLYLEKVWKVYYWTAFILCWGFLPFLSEFVKNGEFTTRNKIKSTLLRNARYYSFMGTVFGSFLIYLWTQNTFQNMTFKGFIIALSNAWGLFQIIIFLGYGVVSIPKYCFKMTDLEKQYNLCMFQVSVCEENFQSSKIDLEELIQNIITLRKHSYEQDLIKLLDEMISQCPMETVNRLQPFGSKDQIDSKYRKGDQSTIVALNRQLKFQLLETKRREVHYEQQLERTFFIEDLYNNQDNKDKRIKSKLVREREGKLGAIIDKMEWIWYIKVKPNIFKILAVMAILLSLALISGELIILLKMDFSILEILPKNTSSALLFNIFSSVMLLYLTTCVYFGLFNIKFTAYYELHSNNQTDSFSLLYSANFLTKLAAPLCVNFLKLLHIEGTAFHRMIGAMDPIPLIGEQFQKIFPATLLLLVFFNAFDLWSKMMKCMGLDEFSFTEIYDEEKVADGKQLCKIERADREREIGSLFKDLETGEKSTRSGYMYSSKYFIENAECKFYRIHYQQVEMGSVGGKKRFTAASENFIESY
eukprot:403349999